MPEIAERLRLSGGSGASAVSGCGGGSPGRGGGGEFLEQLDELRRRIIYSVVAVAVGFIGAWFFRDYLVALVFGPMREFLGEGERLQGLDAAELFVVNIKLAAMAGLLVASPVVMSQIWLFIAPGLYAHEKKWAVPFVVLSTVCFVGGAAFAHQVVFRLTMQFFASFENEYFTFAPRVSNSFGIYLRLMLAFGVVFQLPVVVLFLAKMGVLTARFMIKHFKYALLGIFIISAVVTPGGEVVTQLAAVSSALDRAGFAIISTAMQDCLADPDQAARTDEGLTTEELEKLFLMLA